MFETKAVLVAAFLLFPAAASAGWSAKQSSRTVASSAPPQISSLFFDKGFFRIDQDDNTSVIVDLDAGKFTFLNHAKKQHASITVEELIKMRDQMVAQLKANLDKFPPEERKQMEEKLKEIEGSTDAKNQAQPKATGKTDKVNGYDCAIYTWSGSDGDGEACIATKLNVDVAGFTKATAKLSDKLTKMSGGRGSPASFAMLELGKHGFPIRTRRSLMVGEGVKVDAIMEISELKAAKIEAAKFQVPKDYAKTDLQTLMSGGGAPPPPK